MTHDICDDKLKWIRDNDYATIKVNMSWAGYNINREKIRQSLHDGRMVDCTPRLNIMFWVHYPREAAAQEEVSQQYLATLRVRFHKFQDIASQLRRFVFRLGLQGARHVGNGRAGPAFDDPLLTVCLDHPKTVSVSLISPPRYSRLTRARNARRSGP